MESELTPAIWNGPFPAELPDGSLVYQGEEHPVTAEDLKSSHWTAVGEPADEPEPDVVDVEPEPADEPPALGWQPGATD